MNGMGDTPDAKLNDLIAGVRQGHRRDLGRAITLIESTRAADRRLADQLVAELADVKISSHRVGITGVPGAGKSSVIEALGTRLTGRGHRIAVLAVDPSSSRTGGSILGDKTRMTQLARDPNAFIRPSPTGGRLGGVARRTQEAIVICEAARFDIVLVETVGVGQTEIAVSHMVDTFVLVALTGGGDELQGIKRGVLELVDVVFVNKADGDNLQRASVTQGELERALTLVPARHPLWQPIVLTGSARTGQGLDALWSAVERHRAVMSQGGALDAERGNQRVRWLWQTLESAVLDRLRTDPEVVERLADFEPAVRAGTVLADTATRAVLEQLFGVNRPD